jgi:multidrug efflux pump subunit AcrA (membrane-fusion protein)
MNKEQWKSWSYNGLAFTGVFLVAFAISTQALVHKINAYSLTNKVFFLSVDKDDVVVSSTIAGRVSEILVEPGSHVTEGELLVKLVDESLLARVSALEEVAQENLSARTELELIKARTEEYEIRAPRDGVVYELRVTKGTYVLGGTQVATLFADEGVSLIGEIKPQQYALIEKNRGMSVFSPRLGQVYTVYFHGIGRVFEKEIFSGNNQTTLKEEYYEVKFKLADEIEGASFIEGERFEVVPEQQKKDRLKPAFALARLWNGLILGGDPDVILNKYEEKTQ